MAVPEGTVQDVLDWVGDDPERAEAALDAEQNGQQRTTLVAKLEAIASEEDTVTETEVTGANQAVPAEGGDIEDQAPGPEQPVEASLDAAASGTVIGPVHVRDAEVEPADPIAHDPDGDESQPIDAEQVESLQAVGGTSALVLAVNGQAFIFGPQLAAALKRAVDQGIAGMSL